MSSAPAAFPPADAPYRAVTAYYHDVVGRYVRFEGSLDEAVAAMTAPVEAAFVVARASPQTVEAFFWAAWEPVISAADTSNIGLRRRLVDLLSAISTKGLLARDDGREPLMIFGNQRAYVDLPCFGAQMREVWNWASPPGGTRELWAHMNAFAAQLTVAGIDFSLNGLWTIQMALEDPAANPAEHLPAVLEWLRIAAPMLFAADEPGRTADAGRHDPASPDQLARDAELTHAGLTAQRWQSWRRQVQELASQGGDAADCARLPRPPDQIRIGRLSGTPLAFPYPQAPCG